MHDKKYQVFVSSTFTDLKDERQAAMNSIINLRHIPIGMEGFPAVDQEQMTYITRLIDECDYYVLLLGNRYGSVGGKGVSFTEQEYDYAVTKGKHVLGFLAENGNVEDCDEPEKLAAFKAKVSNGRIIKYWTDRSSLELAVFKSLSEAFESDPRPGWVRADTAPDPRIIGDFQRALSRVAELESQVKEFERPVSIPNLAALGDKVSVKYSVKKNVGYRTISYKVRNETLDVTWRELFIIVANDYRVPRTLGVIENPIKAHIRKLGGDTYEFNIPYHDQITILNQFELLGLMRSNVSRTTEGGQATFYQITGMGEQLLKAGLAVLA